MESELSDNDGRTEKYLYSNDYKKIENVSDKEGVKSSSVVRSGRFQ